MGISRLSRLGIKIGAAISILFAGSLQTGWAIAIEPAVYEAEQLEPVLRLGSSGHFRGLFRTRVLSLGDSWYLTSYRIETGETIAVNTANTLGQTPSIHFSEGEVLGNASCNRFQSTYVLQGNELTMKFFWRTLMGCTDELLAQESRFLTLLGQVASYAMTDDELQLLNADGATLLTFNQSPPPYPPPPPRCRHLSCFLEHSE